MKHKKKIALLWADPFNGNRGVGALAYSTVYLIKKIEEELKCELDITILGTNPGIHKLQLGEMEISIKGIKCINSVKSLLYKLIKPSLFFSYFKFDYILDAGYGDAYSDIYGLQTFEGLDFSKKFYRFIGKKQLMMPQTIGPYKDTTAKKEAIRSIEGCSVVFPRDKLSYDFVCQNTKQKEVYEMIDSAFFMPYKKASLNNDFVNVGIGISALLWRGGYSGKNEFGLKSDYQDLMRKAISYFLKIENVRIHLVPHVVMGDHHIENDYVVSRDIVNEFNDSRVQLSPFFITPIDAKNFISALDFFSGARMHACIAAFSSGVPVFPMAYSRKFNGLFNKTLNYDQMGDMLHDSSEEVLSKLDIAFKSRDVLKEAIDNRLQTIVKKRYDLLMEKIKIFLSN